MRKIEILLPVLKAKCLVLIGKLKRSKLPYEIDCLGNNTSYLARTVYREMGTTKDNCPFNVVIHSKSWAMSVIAHEAVHAANFIQNGMGMEADFLNDELTAYIVQYICEQVEEELDIYK
jgi:hypothetical protein